MSNTTFEPETSTEPENWWNRAKCRNDDPNRYDLDRDRSIRRDEKSRIAEELCEGCPVLAECAADVLENNNIGLVRAGLWFPCPPKDCPPGKEARERELYRRAAPALARA